jgi:hypothetical protein
VLAEATTLDQVARSWVAGSDAASGLPIDQEPAPPCGLL